VVSYHLGFGVRYNLNTIFFVPKYFLRKTIIMKLWILNQTISQTK